MKRTQKKFLTTILSCAFVCSMVFGGAISVANANIAKAETTDATSISYLFKANDATASVTLSDPWTNGTPIEGTHYAPVSGLTYNADWGGVAKNVIDGGNIKLYSASEQAGITHYSIVNMQFANKVTDVTNIKSMSIKMNIVHDGGANNYVFTNHGYTHHLYAVNDDGSIGGCVDIADIEGVQQNVGEQTLTLTQEQIAALAGSDGEIETLQWSGHHLNHVSSWDTYVYISEISYELKAEAEADTADGYLYKAGDATATVSGQQPHSFVDGNINYINTSLGVGVNFFSASETQFTVGAYAAYNYGASLVVFNNPIADVNKLETMTLKYKFRNSNYATVSEDEFIKVYAVNYDETTSVYTPIADSYVSLTVDGEVTLTAADIAKLADANGQIKALQFEMKRYSNTSVEVYNYIDFTEISYMEKDVASYLVNVNVVDGSADFESNLIVVGEKVNIPVTPKEYFSIATVSVTTGDNVAVEYTFENGIISFVMPESEVNVAVVCELSDYPEGVDGYLYTNMIGKSQVSGRIPDAYVDVTVAGRAALGGVVDIFGEYSNEKFRIGVYAGYNVGAALLQFKNPITDASKVKSLTFKFTFVNAHYGSELKEDELIKLFAVEYNEATQKYEPVADRYIEITTDGSLVLTREQALMLADSNGKIEYLQFEMLRYSNTSVEAYNYIDFTEISYANMTEIELAMEAAAEELDGYVSDVDYDTMEWIEIRDIVSAAKTEINACATVEDIAAKVAEAKAAIDEVPTAAEKAAAALAEAKTNAKAELEAYVVEADYETADWATITATIATAKTEIDACESMDDVTAEVAEAKAAIDEVPTAAEKAAAALAEAKTNAKAELEAYVVEADYETADWATITATIAAAKTEIDACESMDDVTAKVAEAKAAIDEVPTAAERAEENSSNEGENDSSESGSENNTSSGNGSDETVSGCFGSVGVLSGIVATLVVGVVVMLKKKEE